MTVSPWVVPPVVIVVIAVAGVFGPGWASGAAVAFAVTGVVWLGWILWRE
ncbi:hypothetical protein ACIA5G_19075 [Amycolatopsis sp. NPDC051758]